VYRREKAARTLARPTARSWHDARPRGPELPVAPPPLAAGNVTRNLRHPDDLAFGIPHWRRGERNLDQATVLALASGFIMVNALPPANAFENCRFLVSAVGGISSVIGLPTASAEA
jgi:hypothetical protein